MSKRLAFRAPDALTNYPDGLYGIIETPDNRMVCATTVGGIGTAGDLVDQTIANWSAGRFNFAQVEVGSERIIFSADIPAAPAGAYYLRVYKPVNVLVGYSPSDTPVGGYRFYWDGTTVTYATAAAVSVGNLAAALVGQTLVPQSPVTREGLEIFQGDAYLVADGRQLVFAKAAGSNWPTDLTGWTIQLKAKKSSANVNSGSATLTVSGVVDVATGSGQQVHVELQGTDTSGLAPGAGAKGYLFEVVATNGSKQATLRAGLMTVVAPIA